MICRNEPHAEPPMADQVARFIADAPEHLQAKLQEVATHAATMRADAIASVASAGGSLYTEVELNAMPFSELRRLAQLAAAPTRQDKPRISI